MFILEILHFFGLLVLFNGDEYLAEKLQYLGLSYCTLLHILKQKKSLTIPDEA